MNESTKCRSGREVERVGFSFPSRRGGKTPHTLGNDERVAAKYDGDVVMPAWKGAPLEVVEAELSLEFLVGSLGSPSFLKDAHDLLLRHASRKTCKGKLRRPGFALGPLHDEPQGFAIARVAAVVVSHLHSPKRKARGEFAAWAYPPRDSSEGAVAERDGEFLGWDGVATTTINFVQQPDFHGRRDRDAYVQAEHSHGISEVARPAIRGVDKHDVARELVFDRARDELARVPARALS